MEVSEKLKERFCKDCNIPLRLYKEPYFTERLQLYDSYYNIYLINRSVKSVSEDY